jgi:hypothetical protein
VLALLNLEAVEHFHQVHLVASNSDGVRRAGLSRMRSHGRVVLQPNVEGDGVAFTCLDVGGMEEPREGGLVKQ